MCKGNKTATLRISDRVAGYLQDWIAVRGKHDGSQFVGVKKSGALTEKITDRGVADLLRNLQEQAGVNPFTTHDLRRSAISKVIDRHGVAVTQTYARHNDPKTTLGYTRSIC